MTGNEAHEDGAIVFELCAEGLQACRIARAAGAGRIEFCANLEVEGLTPDPALTRAAVAESGLPVFMLLRPRAGDFVYTPAEFAGMRDDLRQALSLGVSGFALGVLLPDGRVDVERTRELVELAAPLEVTFHRAFDVTPDLAAALEEIVATGCRRILTSGGASDAIAGAATLAALVGQAAGRVDIAVGGGLRAENARALAERTGAQHFHGSLRYASKPAPAESPRMQLAVDGGKHATGNTQGQSAPVLPIDPQAIEQVVNELRCGAAERLAALGERHVSSRT